MVTEPALLEKRQVRQAERQQKIRNWHFKIAEEREKTFQPKGSRIKKRVPLKCTTCCFESDKEPNTAATTNLHCAGDNHGRSKCKPTLSIGYRHSL
jgi:hypothetical protein